MKASALVRGALALAFPLLVPVWMASCTPTVGALPGGDAGFHYDIDAYVVPSADVYLPDTPPGFFDSLTIDAPLSGPDANLSPDTGVDAGETDASDAGATPINEAGTDGAASDASPG